MALLKINLKPVLLTSVLFMGLCIPADVFAFHIGFDQNYSLHAGHVFMDRVLIDTKAYYAYENAKSYEGTKKRTVSVNPILGCAIGYRLYYVSFINLYLSAAFQYEGYRRDYNLSGESEFIIEDNWYLYEYSLRIQSEATIRKYCTLFLQMDLAKYTVSDKRRPTSLKQNDFTMSGLNDIVFGIKFIFGDNG